MTTAPDSLTRNRDGDVELARWAASGAMWLTGREDEPPLGPPAGLVLELDSIAGRLSRAAAELGATLDVDPLQLLCARAALDGLSRHGTTSCGGSTRLLPTATGWIALALARPDDVDLIPAWLELDHGATDPWSTVESALQKADAATLVARGRLFGLPVSLLPSRPLAGAPTHRRPRRTSTALPMVATDHGPAEHRAVASDVRVLDLSALWAGPLCGELLARAGAEVIKVESIRRPDASRDGSPAFFDLLHGRKRSVALDLRSAEGVRSLSRLVDDVDVVIEASRPRALEQLEIRAVERLRRAGPQVWVSITGHGRADPQRDWIGFGDDTAVAGGLVCRDERGPVFCADAAADPATGLVAAAATFEALRSGRRWLLDIAMSGVAAHLAGPTRRASVHRVNALAPEPPRIVRTAPPLGAHTAQVLARLRP